jgi:hypothetical protein
LPDSLADNLLSDRGFETTPSENKKFFLVFLDLFLGRIRGMGGFRRVKG